MRDQDRFKQEALWVGLIHQEKLENPLDSDPKNLNQWLRGEIWRLSEPVSSDKSNNAVDSLLKEEGSFSLSPSNKKL